MRTSIFFLILALFTCLRSYSFPPADDGKLIFITRCAGCHNVNKALTGPALAGIDQRRSLDWIVQFVSSSQSMINGGDKDAVKLYEQFNRIPMPDHKDLTRKDIENIVQYIKATTVTVAEEAAPFSRPPGKLRPAYLPLSIQNNYVFFIAFLGAVVLLIFGLLLLVKVKAMERESSMK